jgi:hypothetical protein
MLTEGLRLVHTTERKADSWHFIFSAMIDAGHARVLTVLRALSSI